MGEVKGVACCDRCGVALPDVPTSKGIRVFCPECGRVEAVNLKPAVAGSATSQSPILPDVLRAVAVFNFLAAFVGAIFLTGGFGGLWAFLWAVAFGQAGLFWLVMAALVDSTRR